MKTDKDPRHLKRIRLFKALYSRQFPKTKAGRLNNQETLEFKLITEHLESINQLIDRYSTKFGVSKMSKLDLSILQLGVYELTVSKKEPVKVVIDECIELAKEFGGTRSPNLINGILGKLIENKNEDQN